MKNHSPAFERSLRRQVDAAVQGSPALRKEFARRSHLGRWRRVAAAVGWVFVVGPCWGLPALLALEMPFRPAGPATLAVCLLWLGGWFAAIWAEAGEWETARLPLWPESPGGLLTRHWARLRGLAAYWGLAAGGGLLGLGGAGGWTLPAWLAWALSVLLATLFFAAACVWLALSFPPRLRSRLTTGIIYGSGLLFFLEYQAANLLHQPDPPAWLSPVLTQGLRILHWLLPTAWPWAWLGGIKDGAWQPAVWLLLPTLGVIATLPCARRRLERAVGRAVEHDPITPPSAAVAASSAATPPRNAAGEISVPDIWFAGRSVPAGWWDRRLRHWFTAREQALADFAFPPGTRLGGAWRRIFTHAGLTLLLGLAMNHVSPAGRDWVLVTGGALVGAEALVSVWSTGRAFERGLRGPLGLPATACFPRYAVLGIGYRELSRMLFKHSVIQLPALVFLGAAGAGLGFALGYGDGWTAAGWGARISLLCFGLGWGQRPLQFAESNQIWPPLFAPSVLVALAFVLGYCVLACFAVITGDATSGRWLTAALAEAWLADRAYGRLYNRGFFDLPRPAPGGY